MKTKILLLILLCPVFIFGQTWDYPIKPGTEQWKKIKTYKEQLEVYNIPIDVLERISTKELVNVCLSYPEWRLISAYDNYQTGFSTINQIFNGFNELLSRKDAAKELLEKYKSMDPLAIKKDWTLIEKGTYAFSFVCIEILLSNPSIIAKLTNEEESSFLKEAIKKYKGKESISDIYSLWDLSPTSGICMNILEKRGMKFNEVEQKSVKLNLITNNKKVLDYIIEESEKKL